MKWQQWLSLLSIKVILYTYPLDFCFKNLLWVGAGTEKQTLYLLVDDLATGVGLFLTTNKILRQAAHIIELCAQDNALEPQVEMSTAVTIKHQPTHTDFVYFQWMYTQFGEWVWYLQPTHTSHVKWFGCRHWAADQ